MSEENCVLQLPTPQHLPGPAVSPPSVSIIPLPPVSTTPPPSSTTAVDNNSSSSSSSSNGNEVASSSTLAGVVGATEEGAVERSNLFPKLPISNTTATSTTATAPPLPRIPDFDQVGKLSPNERADSPDTNCAICLGKLQNKSFTDSCLHQFCFTCLLQWSKVKAECPLCKQSFKSIIHNVRSIEDYDQYHLPRFAVPGFSHQLLNELTPPRFRYRTTMASGASPLYNNYQRFEQMLSHGDLIPPFIIPRHSQWHSGGHNHNHGGSSSNNSTGNRRSPRLIYADLILNGIILNGNFRRHIYTSDMWVRRVPDLTGRFRECSAEFFLNNPAQIHRLVPWLNRELHALLGYGEHDEDQVLSIILNLLPRYNIRSQEFRSALLPYLGDRTDHFVHEFYAFGTSPYDMVGYDRISTYGPRFNFNDLSDSSSDSDVQIVDVVENSNAGAGIPQVPSCPLQSTHHVGSPVAGPSNLRSLTTLASRISSSLIALSSGDDSDDSSDCEVIGTVKPRHLRTPEIITLDSDSDNEHANQAQENVVTDDDEESEVESKPQIHFDFKLKINHGVIKPKVRRPSLLSERTRTASESLRRSCTTRTDRDNETNGRRKHLHSRSERSKHYRLNSRSSSLVSSSGIGDSNGEEWSSTRTSKKLPSRKRKRDKRKRSVSEKKVKDTSKNKKTRKDKKGKQPTEKHWKKKLCRKIETTSSSSNSCSNSSCTSSDESCVKPNTRKKKLMVFSSPAESEHSDSDQHKRKGRVSRLRSVVHVRRNAQDSNDLHSQHSSHSNSSFDVGVLDRGSGGVNGLVSRLGVDGPSTSGGNEESLHAENSGSSWLNSKADLNLSSRSSSTSSSTSDSSYHPSSVYPPSRKHPSNSSYKKARSKRIQIRTVNQLNRVTKFH